MTNELHILCHALGMNNHGQLSGRNNYSAPPGSANRETCMQLVTSGLMSRVDDEDSDSFKVSEQGIAFARDQLLEGLLEELLRDRISTEANITASERVSPNALEYESLCESLEEDPKIAHQAAKLLCRSLLRLSCDLASALGDATQKAACWAPDEFDTHQEKTEYDAALLSHQQCLNQSTQLIGLSSARLRDLNSAQTHQERPSMSAENKLTNAADGRDPEQRTIHAVFEVLPEDTPVQWTSNDYLYVKNTLEPTAVSMIAGIRLPDQTIAVLRTTMGEALGKQAHERASQLTGGRVVEVSAVAWPNAKQCFAAIREECERTDEDLPTPSPMQG